MPSFKILFIVTLIFNLSVYPQNNDAAVAEAGPVKISAKEFKIRYELMPKLSEAGFNTDTLKNEFIHSLIAEKLWAMEAASKGYDTTGYFRQSFDQLEKLFLKDALFKAEVESKINITNDEIEKGVNRSRNTLKVQIWAGTDSADSYRIYGLTQKGLSFDSLEIPETDITYGNMDDDKIEDLLYSLKPGEYSKPVNFRSGWFIFHLKNKIFTSKDDNEKILSDVKRNIKERKAREIGTKFLSVFLKDVKADADTNLFKELANKISNELKNKTPDEFEEKEQTLFLSETTVKKITGSYPDNKLHSSFITINGKSFSLYDFLFFLKFDILSAKTAELNGVMARLKNKIDYFIEQELLSAEAKKRKMHLTQNYSEELRIWKENYLAQMIRTEFLSSLSVNDAETYEFYLELSNRTDSVAQINILEVLSSDLTVIETVLNELKNGRDFRELASIHTEREWTKSKGGEFGLFPVTLFREISEAAANMNVGDIYGPLKLKEGYSVFKLIEKKDAVKSFIAGYETVREQLRNDLLMKKYQNLVDDETVRLAQKYNVKINHNLIKQIPVSDIEMFTHRYMGFGGRISAVPYTTPWHSWRKRVEIKNL
jgi:parvulin-like peptidyl-prolyl isomerase